MAKVTLSPASPRPQDRLFIGTAGWSIPRIHQTPFPVEGSHLERYAAVFSGVEINTSFHRPHRRSTYELWAAAAPSHFRFSVKAPKTITHAAQDTHAADLDAFFAQTAGLGAKLGPILIQLPPKRDFDAAAARLLSAFRDRTAGGLVVEPRHASWFRPEVEDVLRALEIARAAADPPRADMGDRPGGWSGLAYFRLHGSPVIYRSPYGEERLEAVSRRLLAAALAGASAWCIFDNTTLYAATGDALALRRIAQTRCGAWGSRKGGGDHDQHSAGAGHQDEQQSE